MDAFRQHVIYITAIRGKIQLSQQYIHCIDDDLYQEVVLVVEEVSGV